MSSILLETKISPPPARPYLVTRPRLLERLDAGLVNPATLVSAPAGFGKTILVSEWLYQRDGAKAWFTLDTGDNDPALFLAYLIAALARVDEGMVAGAQQILESHRHSDKVIMTQGVVSQLINDIVKQGPSHLILVLDDYHFIEEPAIHEATSFLLNHQPANMHLVIVSRADPPLPIARLRGQGQVNEIRQEDLRFTTAETEEFLDQYTGLSLSDPAITALSRRTEGWIAGLLMAAASMRGQDTQAATDFINAFSGSNRFILDYLLEEVLSRQPEAIQTFLVHTSILERMCGLLCDDVIGGAWADQAGAQSQPILEYLERANLFVNPLDDKREWYRYHRLFSDLLRNRLQELNPELAPTLHLRASAWFAAHDYPRDAITHALAASDFERAVQLIDAVAEETLGRSELTTFLYWMDAIPAAFLRNQPNLALYQAWALLLSGRRPQEVAQRLRDLDGEADLMQQRTAPLRALIALFEGEMPRAAELSQKALDQLPEGESFLRNLALLDMTVAHFAAGDTQAGKQALRQSYELARRTGNVMIAVMSLSQLAETVMMEGSLREAASLYQQAFDEAVSATGERLPISGVAQIGLGQVYWEWNRLAEARVHLREGIAQSEHWGKMGAMDGYIALARVANALGDERGAQDAMQEAARLISRWDTTGIYVCVVEMMRAQLQIQRGDTSLAEKWAETRHVDLTTDSDPTGLREVNRSYLERLRKYEWLVLAHLRYAQGRYSETLALLDLSEPAFRRRNRPGRIIEVAILRALARQALGQNEAAFQSLQEALQLAQPEGYVRVFVNEGESLVPLLYEAISAGMVSAFTSQLIEAIATDTDGPLMRNQSPETVEGGALLEPLSEREREVLAHIAMGLSNQGIAERLVLSPATIKWHASNIYAKLGVSNRTEAVNRARTLGLIPAD